MTEDDTRVPAGWYPDPLGLPQLRWWDNHAWTEHVSDARQPMVAQETVTTATRFADDPDDDPVPDFSNYEGFASRRERLDFERGFDPDEQIPESDVETETPVALGEPLLAFDDPRLSLEAPAREQREAGYASPAERLLSRGGLPDAPTSARYDLDTRFDDLLGDEAEAYLAAAPRSAQSHLGDNSERYVPESFDEMTARAGASAGGATGTEPTVSTGPVWILALTPLIMLMLGMLFLLSGAAGTFSPVFVGVILGVPYLAGVALAVADRRQLLRAGHRDPAHWAWAFLTIPTYLLVRLASVVRATGRGYGPLLTWGALTVFVLGAIIAVPGLVIGLAPAQFAAEAEASVRYDGALRGADSLEVDCPDVPPLLVQQSFQCGGHTPRGGDFPITVSLQRANGWIEWRVDDWGVGGMAG
ncbi:MAG: DUF2510 domain-containing protein [Actinomycetales bacterium]|nr:DUF2510 domain-containing protein [Actinomycetales bacterium]